MPFLKRGSLWNRYTYSEGKYRDYENDPLPSIPTSEHTDPSQELEPPFQCRYVEFFKNEMFSDCFLAQPDSEELIPVHRVVLASQSRYFRELFLNYASQPDTVKEIRTNEDGHLTIYLPTKKDLWSTVISVIGYMYCQKITVTPANVIEGVVMAEFFHIPELIHLLNRYISSNLQPNSVLILIGKLTKYPTLPNTYLARFLDILNRFCTYTVLLDNTADLDQLPFPIFYEIISRSIFYSAPLLERIKIITGYINRNITVAEDELPTDEEVLMYEKLIAKLEIDRLNSEELEIAYTSDLLPREIITAALLDKLKTQKGRTLARSSHTLSSTMPPHPRSSGWNKFKRVTQILKSKAEMSSSSTNPPPHREMTL